MLATVQNLREVAGNTKVVTQAIKELLGFQDLDNSGTEQGKGRSVEGPMTNTASHSTGSQDVKRTDVITYTNAQHVTSAHPIFKPQVRDVTEGFTSLTSVLSNTAESFTHFLAIWEDAQESSAGCLRTGECWRQFRT